MMGKVGAAKICVIGATFFLFGQANGQIETSLDTSTFINLHDVGSTDANFEGFENLKALLEGVEVVALGEQSHYEGTTTKTKVKLIKYLHEACGFDILAFESGFIEGYLGNQLAEQGKVDSLLLLHNLSDVWSITEEIAPLFEYIEAERRGNNPISVVGFDSQVWNSSFLDALLDSLAHQLADKLPVEASSAEWQQLRTDFSYAIKFQRKKLSRKTVLQDTTYINRLIDFLSQLEDLNTFYIQALRSAKIYLIDLALNTNLRDRQMAENLLWLKHHYPNKKIICWGATSHFLYHSELIRMKSPIIQILAGRDYKNNRMMGDVLKAELGDKLYTIGFTAYSGWIGFGSTGPLSPAPPSSLEGILAHYEYHNVLIPLKGTNLAGLISRPLGNNYMKTSISEVMDAVIFNRIMEPQTLHRRRYQAKYPNNPRSP